MDRVIDRRDNRQNCHDRQIGQNKRKVERKIERPMKREKGKTSDRMLERYTAQIAMQNRQVWHRNHI